MAIQNETKRINVTLPLTLLEELRAFIPKRQRNQFIVSALTREIDRFKLQQALRESRGSWSTEDYPALATATDIETYVRELRASYQPHC